jgi:hypothetical protein
LQNRVSPLGEIVAAPERGLVFGNRGCLHDADGRLRRQHNGRRWIACRLEFRGRRRPLVEPGRYTALFFLDEATAFAAGHRPCAECRHEDYRRFTSIWSELHPGDRGADAIDSRLHGERLGPRREADGRSLPDGAFALVDGAPQVVVEERLWRWTPGGYVDPGPRPRGRVAVLTPPSLVDVLRRGWRSSVPFLHPSSGGLEERSATVPGRTTHV